MENKAGKPEGCVCTYDLRKGIFANVRVKKSLLFYLFYDTPPCLGLEKPFLFYQFLRAPLPTVPIAHPGRLVTPCMSMFQQLDALAAVPGSRKQQSLPVMFEKMFDAHCVRQLIESDWHRRRLKVKVRHASIRLVHRVGQTFSRISGKPPSPNGELA